MRDALHTPDIEQRLNALQARELTLSSPGRVRDERGKVIANVSLDLDVAISALPELIRALRFATAYVEMFTGHGARENPPGWPRNSNGNIDAEEIARICRGALAKAVMP